MYHCLTVHVYQSLCNVFELSGTVISERSGSGEDEPTSSNRFTSWLSLTNSLIFPFSIHSDAIEKREMELSIVTPNSGSTFGWRSAFQVTTSLQNLCDGRNKLTSARSLTLSTHACYLLKIARRVNPQHLDCNTAALVFPLPNICVPAVIQWSARTVVAKRDFQ